MFASKNIKLGDELTFSYGDSVAEAQLGMASEHNTTPDGTAAMTLVDKRRHCYCKSDQCYGFLPSG